MLLALVGMLLALVLAHPAVSAASNVSFVGAWDDEPYANFTITSQAPSGACTGTSIPGFRITGCQVTGDEYVFVVEQEGTEYRSYNHGTIEGSLAHGFFHDTNGTEVSYTAHRVSGGPSGGVSGTVLDLRGASAPGVKLALTGTSEEEKPVSASATSNSEGKYSFAEIPAGKYTVVASGEPTGENGGSLTLSENASSDCLEKVADSSTCKLQLGSGEEVHLSFTYTYCTAKERLTKEKPSTGCPVIFIPGFLGSRIVCNSGELWPNIPIVHFGEMVLEANGETNSSSTPCSASAGTVPGQAGVVSTAALKDVYGKTLEFLNKIEAHGGSVLPENGAYAFTYDWRKSPLITLNALNTEVDEVLAKTKAARVVIEAHSMGGLVTQAYVANPSYAAKVARAITLGTPYWGAPKSSTALLVAKSSEPAPELFGLDLFLFRGNLQLAARNMQGLYWLYPSDHYGPWMQVNELSPFKERFVRSSELGPLVQWLGGTPALLTKAVEGHAAYDGITTNGVDYRVLIGTGVPTITSEEVNASEFWPAQFERVWFGSGDGTVPAASASMGASEGRTPPGDSTPITYTCEIDHVSLPGNGTVQKETENFLLIGEAPPTGKACPYTGTETELYEDPLVHASSSSVQQSARVVTPSGGSMTLEQAAESNLVQLIHNGPTTIVVTESAQPVTLQLQGKGLALTLRSLTSSGKGPGTGSGPPRYFGPLSGTVAVGPTGTVTRAGKPVKAGKQRKAAHITVHVVRRGKRFVVRLSIRGATGIYVKLGKGTPALYRHPLRLTKAQLKKLRFSTVNVFGIWSAAGRVRRIPR